MSLGAKESTGRDENKRQERERAVGTAITNLLTSVPSPKSLLFSSLPQRPAPSALTCLSPSSELGIKPGTRGQKGGGGGRERRGKKRGDTETSFSYSFFSFLPVQLLERGLDPFQPRTLVERTANCVVIIMYWAGPLPPRSHQQRLASLVSFPPK